MKKSYFLHFVLMFWFSVAISQTNYNKLPVYIPASPNAAELSKYENLDGFQRLKFIKDQNGNIVKSYKYYYKP